MNDTAARRDGAGALAERHRPAHRRPRTLSRARAPGIVVVVVGWVVVVVAMVASLNMYRRSTQAARRRGQHAVEPRPDGVAPAMCASLYIAAYRGRYSATEEEEAEEAETDKALSFDAFDDAVEAIIHVINNHGVPMWNSGDYAGCARAYTRRVPFRGKRAHSRRGAGGERGQPDDESFDSRMDPAALWTR